MSCSSKTSWVRPNFIFSNESLEYLECLEKKKIKNPSGGKKVRIFLRSAGFFAKNRPIFEIFEIFFRNYLDLIWLQKSDIKSFFVTSHMSPPELFFTFPRFLGLKFENVISLQRNGRDQRYLVHKLGSYKGFKWWHFYRQIQFTWNHFCSFLTKTAC